MGCLQRSDWVSPHDIRPEYADLLKAMPVRFYTYLLQCRTVLGQPDNEIVQSAWDWDSLRESQECYQRVYSLNLSRIPSFSPEQLATLAREEMAAYITVMEKDPFLPLDLLPRGYTGMNAHELHSRVTHTIREAV